MRRRASIVVCLAAALAAVPPAHAAPATRLTSVKLLSCTPEARSAVYEAGMTTVPGADQMALRFTLLARRTARRHARVRVPGLRHWHRSKPGVREYVWKQELLNLAAGSVYRVRVNYRWFAADGTVVRSERRRSAVCRQLSTVPNLRSRILSAAATLTEGVMRYRIELGNDGEAPARDATLRLAVDGAVVDVQTRPLLAAGEYRVLTVHGPACRRWVEASADPEDTLVESSESDNVDSIACADLVPG